LLAGRSACLGKGNDIGKHMAGIGKQRQAVSQYPAGQFGYQYQAAEYDAILKLTGDRRPPPMMSMGGQNYIPLLLIWLSSGLKILTAHSPVLIDIYCYFKLNYN
jgi:hypothetical protein